MCNASQGVLNKGIEIGTEKGIEIGTEKGIIIGKIKAYAEIGFTIEEIAEKLGISEQEITDALQ